MAPLPAASSAQVRGHGGGAGAVETRGAGWGRRRGGDGGVGQRRWRHPGWGRSCGGDTRLPAAGHLGNISSTLNENPKMYRYVLYHQLVSKTQIDDTVFNFSAGQVADWTRAPLLRGAFPPLGGLDRSSRLG